MARGGRVWWGAIAALVVLAGVASGGYAYYRSWASDNSPESAAILHPVSRSVFEHFVVERGDLESSSNEEVRCLVKAEYAAGTAILKIVPAGKIVKKGDFLIQFDDSALRTQLTQQKIYVANALAMKTQNETALKTAEATLQEYINGTSKQEQELARGEVFVAEENLRRAEEYLRFAERLAARNYINAVQLDAERFSVQKAAKDLDAANTKLDVLQNHTYQKMVAQLNGAIAQAKAALVASEATFALETSRMNVLEDQVARCHVVAPGDGQVVYYTNNDRRRDEETIIEEGAIIREGQTVIRLPDTTQMQVKTVVNESRINLVRPGAIAKIELDSIPGVFLDGFVESVDAFPMSRRWSSSTKEYGATVKITSPAANLKPGLRAKVTIVVANEPNALQVPVQSIVERDGVNYCLVSNDGALTAKPVDIGPNNDKFVVVNGGLSEGDQVALDGARYAEDVEFPDAPQAPALADRGNERRRGRLPAESAAKPRPGRPESGG
ncbi:MAG: HlyD family efflux transporter periplasmic adaptor subunit [Pirellulales bacterium]